MVAKLLAGPQLIRVGERKPGDKTYAVDEYILAPPGTIVAPRRKGEPPTPENAARAIIKKAKELGMLDANTDAGRLMGLQTGGAVRRGRTAGGTMAGTLPHFTAFRNRFRESGMVGNMPVVPPTRHKTAAPATLEEGFARMRRRAGGPRMFSRLVGAQTGVGSIPYAVGGDPFLTYLQLLLGAGQLLGPDLMSSQLNVMNALGFVNPAAIGVTDPTQFRELVAQGGMPTLAAELGRRKQSFDESLYGFSEAAPSRGNVPTVASS